MRCLCCLSLLGTVFAANLTLAAEKPPTVTPSASFCFPENSLPAMCDGKEPKKSGDTDIPRLTFGDRKGTVEWVQYEFDGPTKVADIDVYWVDGRPKGECRVPREVKVLIRSGYRWVTVAGVKGRDIVVNEYHHIAFEPVVTTGLRLEVALNKNHSAGILEWKINGQTPKLGGIGRVGPEEDHAKKLKAKLSETDTMTRRIQEDWVDQDAIKVTLPGFDDLAAVVIKELGDAGAKLESQRDKLAKAQTPADDPRWQKLYLDACEQRRAARLAPHKDSLRRVIFTKHHDLGGQHYAYTEDVSDSPYRDNNPFPPSGKLCLLEMDGIYGKVRELIDEPDGFIRDPDVSYDGKRVLFAWRKDFDKDDYHLYEMDMETEKVRQITSGRGVADYEGCYLPDGSILFNSTRCQQIVDCWWADVSNLYTCDADGKYLRRLSFDQVHTNYPQVLEDGRVIYTRWDYNDRGQLFPQPLFQMNPDGTAQTEFYGNNSWFPTAIFHARGIPGTQKVLCVFGGHHTYQKGKLGIIDPMKGRQENSGTQLIAPVRATPAVKIDRYGYTGEQFQYPYPLNQTEFLVTYSTEGSKKAREKSTKPFGIYYMDIDGNRELLAADPAISCNQSIPLMPRKRPRVRASDVDYRKATGDFFLQDVYTGPGLKGIPRGTIKKLRVVALDFRAAGVGSNGNRGPAGGALVSTPISINGAWDVKRVLGTTKIYDDGSAAFTVPARTPVYFQALDAKNHVVQTMRSWSTLQPGETFACVGCHEDKNSTPPAEVVTEAMSAGAKPLTPFPGGSGGFSFPKLVQPILDKHCVSCHSREKVAAKKIEISLEGVGPIDARSKKAWTDGYKGLLPFASWVSPQSVPPMLEPYHAGAAKSPLVELLEKGHEKVKLSPEEMEMIACWIDLAVPFAGEYTEGMDPSAVPTYERFHNKRKAWEAKERENIEALIRAQAKK